MSLITPLKLGNKTFSNNLIQGPLAGLSCSPFRRLIWQYSKPAFSCTEMISCKTLIHQSDHAVKRFINKATDEGPVCFQLSGSDASELAEATKMATAYGADLIDLNCGCPVKKIRSKGAGSRLLTEPSKLYHLITAMKQNTHVPVSIKIRVEDVARTEKFNRNIAQVIQDAGADFLVVHGRHWTEHYETPCRHDEIKFFVDEVKIPVIGNGDIACSSSLKTMLATGCAGAMIARSGVGQPWLIAKLIAEMNQEPFQTPSLQETCSILIEHVSDLSQLLNGEKFAIIQARKFAKYYARQLSHRVEFCNEINHCETMQQFISICKTYFN